MNLVPSEASPIFTNRYDAIVVGSGSGGSALALRLGQLGMEVLIVEAGDYLRPESIAPGPNGRFIHEITGRPGSAQQFVGGPTKFYGAALYRLRESDFLETEHPDGAVSPPGQLAIRSLNPITSRPKCSTRCMVQRKVIPPSRGVARITRSNPSRMGRSSVMS